MRLMKPVGSCFQARLWRKTRMVFIPRPSAQVSSRSMVGRSKVSACHISSSLMAVLGMKLLPTSQGWFAYQSLACWGVHWGGAALVEEGRRKGRRKAVRNRIFIRRMVASFESDESCKKSKSVSSAAKADWLPGGYVGAKAPTPICNAELRFGPSSLWRSQGPISAPTSLWRSPGSAPLQEIASCELEL